MSKLNDLITQLCPDGVEYRRLGEVVKIVNGRDYKHLNHGNIPVYGSGGPMNIYVDDYSVEGPTVLLPRKGSIENVFYVEGGKRLWNVDTIFYTICDDNMMNSKFFYYLMNYEHLERLANSISSTRPSLSQSILYRLEIPVPPLIIQQKIVEILDKFTMLQAELQTELILRRQQYEYYRNQLLTFDPDDPAVEWRRLGEVCELVRGKGLSKSDKNTGEVPIILYGELYTTYENYIDAVISHASTSAAMAATRIQKNDLLMPVSSTTKEAQIGRVVVYRCGYDAYLGGDAVILRHKINPSYLMYLLNGDWFERLKMQNVRGTTISHLNINGLSKVKIPIPPLSTQQRIVDILDKFSDYTTSLTNGLPAEIKLRQQQYEYYRDKLLSFRREGARR